MPIDNGVWYARIGIFNNLFIFRFTSAKKSHNSSFNIFSKISSNFHFTVSSISSYFNIFIVTSLYFLGTFSI